MKNLILIFISVATATNLFAQEAKFLGKISNPNSDMVYLSTFIVEEGKRQSIKLDSSSVDNEGKFTMSALLDKTTECIFFDGSESTKILLTPGDEVYLTMNTKLFDETLVYSGKGAEKNNALKNIFLYEEVIGTTFMSFPEDADTVKMFAYLDNAYTTHKEVIEDYSAEIIDLKDYGNQLIDGIEQSKSRTKGRVIQQREFKKFVAELKGKAGIDFEGVDLEGNNSKVSDYKGKTTVIDFWATWCGPCKAEMPAYKALEEKYEADINFLSVAVWCDKADWETMATELGFKNNIYLAKGEDKQIKDYSVRFIPRYIVLDKDFNILDADAPRPSSGDLEKYF